jgi:molybdopterin-biosynthesis enzyme MoeA-like protein
VTVNLEIICIGNELLIGKVQNTNAHWLATQVTSLGANRQQHYAVDNQEGNENVVAIVPVTNQIWGHNSKTFRLWQVFFGQA